MKKIHRSHVDFLELAFSREKFKYMTKFINESEKIEGLTNYTTLKPYNKIALCFFSIDILKLKNFQLIYS